jgi:hypothetical protein
MDLAGALIAISLILFLVLGVAALFRAGTGPQRLDADDSDV